jgi:hypothetical protein
MNNKRRIIDLIEFYINDHRNEDLNLMYGNGSKIKIKDIGYSTSNKSIFIDCSIILGDIITEEILDRTLSDILIIDSLKYFFPAMKLTINVNYDV